MLGEDGGDVFCTGLKDRAPFVLIASLGAFFTDSDCDVTVVVVLVPNVDICPPRPNGNNDLDFLRQPCAHEDWNSLLNDVGINTDASRIMVLIYASAVGFVPVITSFHALINLVSIGCLTPPENFALIIYDTQRINLSFQDCSDIILPIFQYQRNNEISHKSNKAFRRFILLDFIIRLFSYKLRFFQTPASNSPRKINFFPARLPGNSPLKD